MCIYPEDYPSVKETGSDGKVIIRKSPIVEITNKEGEQISVFWGVEEHPEEIGVITPHEIPSFDEIPPGEGSGGPWEK
jgi:hypothetical protein